MRETERKRENMTSSYFFFFLSSLAFLAAIAWRSVHTSSTFLLVASMYFYIYIAMCALSFHCCRSRWHIGIDSHNEKESERKEARHDDDHRSLSFAFARSARYVFFHQSNLLSRAAAAADDDDSAVNRGHWICVVHGAVRQAKAKQWLPEHEKKRKRRKRQGRLSMVNSCCLFENEERGREIGMRPYLDAGKEETRQSSLVSFFLSCSKIDSKENIRMLIHRRGKLTDEGLMKQIKSK